MLNKLAATNFQLVELKVPANTNSTRLYFQDQPNLRDKQIEKIEFYNGISYAPSGVSCTLAEQTAFVTFADSNGDEFIQNMSIHEITGIQVFNALANTFNFPFAFEPKNIVFPKSFVSYSVAAVVPTAYSLIFGVYYK